MVWESCVLRHFLIENIFKLLVLILFKLFIVSAIIWSYIEPMVAAIDAGGARSQMVIPKNLDRGA